jgi:hypothetical protein
MIAAAILVSLPAFAITWSLVAWWSVLPADLPSQWSGDKVVSRLPTVVFVGAALLVGVASAAFAWYAAISPRAFERPRRVFLIAGSAAATAAAAWLLSGKAASRPNEELGPDGLWAIAALFYGLAPFAVAVARPTAPDISEVEGLTLGAGEEVAWSRTQPVKLFVWVAAVCVVLAVGLGYLPMILAGVNASNASVAIVTSILATTSLMFARIRVTVDRRGLRARSATCGIPLVALRLADMVAAEAISLDPLRWGGWGYRIAPAGRALVLRAGPAIVVKMENGRDVAVTTPDAEQAVSVLRALLHRRAD